MKEERRKSGITQLVRQKKHVDGFVPILGPLVRVCVTGYEHYAIHCRANISIFKGGKGLMSITLFIGNPIYLV